MRVHTSNFKIAGFAKEVPIGELVALGRKHDLLVADDLGSGAMVDLEPHGVPGEPLVSSSIAAGADVVMFSGDKLLGGTQGGLIVGTADAIAKIRRHPIFRAVRPDKLQLAALEATLRLYRDPAGLKEALPVFGILIATRAELREKAAALAAELMAACPRVVAAVADDMSSPGSGSLPTVEIPTSVVRVTAAECPAAELGRRLRAASPPIFTRIKDDAVVIDLRTLQPGEGAELCAALVRVLEN
jgi:L-seryl-tRNA(Ser) seleniumtransferase